ncbi:DUF6318 family protein [Specibacter sp. NPDC078709]|uniref:DUF6318 family protein n=1 Tax=Specibacter sp. NPDC078709 TaxID=3154364 RepID=UPI00343C1B73
METSSPATTTATSTSTAEQQTPPPTSAAVYKPATADGPAQNVPIPVLPETAKEFSKEGLLAFAEHWYSTLGYAFETGDSGPMMQISEPSCKTCLFIKEPVENWYKEGGWAVGGQMNILQTTSPFSETTDGAYQAMLLVRQTKVSYYSADGKLTKDHPQAIARTNLVEAVYTNGGWIAMTAEILKKS